MVDKIYIPTLGRIDKQITWNGLPDFLKDITVLVVQPKEQHLHNEKPIVVLPENNIGISNTRKWIMEKAHKETYGVFDDDLEFVKRLPKGNKPSKIKMSDDDWKDAISKIESWLDSDYSFAGFRRQDLPPREGYEWSDNTETLQAIFYNGNKCPKPNDIEWKPKLYAEDKLLHLQLILLGHKNRVWNKYGYLSKQHVEGGCQSDTSISDEGRTDALIKASDEYLVSKYSPYAHFVNNRLQIQYVKALGKGQQGTLEDFM